MAGDPPKEVLDGLEALRARSALHASCKNAGLLRVASGAVGPGQRADMGTTAVSAKASALISLP